ncbi:pyruvate dehydrogenase (quinone) [Antricoccus suffuscus]|uniref:Pyruvate dehydrogenase (Quinone) n=1 Tax=Antricoccus suffuscus TaxID=1629062 RepID=A0A2T0ZVV3_9ACTN|nr:thiamine pyrophosphate-dependent enzyme [Antricoccus suffuscus]PRZ40463.1 pyruvate dehydrogenase (quinone) [Antricoccus suffuscus]
MTTVAEHIIDSLADLGVTSVWGVVGDALNPVTDAIRKEDRIDWIGVRHEEVAAFAAGSQAQLSGNIGVCMGTVGPGSIHLLNGLYDAKKSHAPVLAICGQVPSAEIGTDFFQEVNNDALFADVSVFARTLTSPEQLPYVLEQAVNAAIQLGGVAVLTLPGDIGGLDVPSDTRARFIERSRAGVPATEQLDQAAELLNDAKRVTLLAGMGARESRAELLQLAASLQAPMVLTIKGKEGLEGDNEFQVGQSGLIGNPAAQHAFDECDVLFMIGTDFPYREWYPEGKTVIQLDARGEHIGRRTHVDLSLVGDAGSTLRALLPRLTAKPSDKHLAKSREKYVEWLDRQKALADPEFDRKGLGVIRRHFDNTSNAIRPELVAAVVDRHAANDAIFTSDTGMSTVWLSRLLELRGSRKLVGSFNLGSMANAMPQALGAAQLYGDRQVIAFCGDGGLTMLLGDLITAVTYKLPVKLIVFNNGRLGMVKLEQEQGGLAEFGTILHNPVIADVATACGLHGIRVEDPEKVEAAITEALAHDGPVLVDIVTNPEEISLPPKVKLSQGWGFAIAKSKEILQSRGAD